MKQRAVPSWREPLLGQLHWFMRLRWFAGLGVVAAALLDWWLTRWFAHEWGKVGIGLGILFYNAALGLAMKRVSPGSIRRRQLLALALGQFLLDVVALALLANWTGGVRSPLLGFFVLHMVFAGLLLPRTMAYAGMAATMAILALALWMGGRWPDSLESRLVIVGWAGALVGTMLVSTHIARALRRKRRRLIRQNARILQMSRQLRKQQRAMMQSEKMSALGQMAAGVAHEIANPLASMDSLLQIMIRKPERVTPQTLTTLREQIDRISRIVRELTTFSHPIETQWQRMDVNEVVRGTLDMLAFDTRLKRVRLEQEFSEKVGSVPMLPQALQQVIINLVRNSLDAMEQVESPRLRIRTAREDEWCVIEVHDNGEGIEPRDLRRLFEPFFTTKPLGKGTGLGLSISYALVQKHGGSIGARSKPGEGTSFVVKLPMSPRAAAVRA